MSNKANDWMGSSVRMLVYTNLGTLTDPRGNQYYVFYNFKKEDQIHKREVMRRMVRRILTKKLSGIHTGGKFYDMQSQDPSGNYVEIGTFGADGNLNIY